MPSSTFKTYTFRQIKRQIKTVWPHVVDWSAFVLLALATFVVVFLFSQAVMPQDLEDRNGGGGDCRKIDAGIILELRRMGSDQTLTIARYQIMSMAGERCLPPDHHTWGVTRCFTNLRKQTICKDVPFRQDPRDPARMWFQADLPGTYSIRDLPSVSFSGPDPSLDYSARAYFQKY